MENPTALRSVLLLIASLLLATNSFAQRRVGDEVPSVWQQDAELTDVHFLDAKNGWAVGEHGTILRTKDGGANWELSATSISVSYQQSQITGEMKRLLGNLREQTGGDSTPIQQSVKQSLDIRLESISFANEKYGMAAGGYHVPYTDITRSVLLQTKDGGETWSPQSRAPLPRITRLCLSDPVGAWAIGNHSYFNDSAIFESFDLGGEWLPKPISSTSSWIDAARTSRGWVLVDTNGLLHVVEGDRIRPAVITDKSIHRIDCLVMLNDDQGWAAGAQGTILKTEDGGMTWYVPNFVRQNTQHYFFDFCDIKHTGDQVWIAGSPGTHVFCIEQNKSLASHRTNQTSKLNSIEMQADGRGWLVGSHGTILHTTDGGKTWVHQRGDSHQVAILAIGLDSDNVAFEALCRCSAADGFLAAILRLNLQGVNNHQARITEAAARLGAMESRCFTFDFKPNTRFDQTAQQVVLRRLVPLIRELQPNVIVADAQASRMLSGSYVDAFLLLEEAIKLAADPNYMPEQIAANGLAAWQVDRLAVPNQTSRGQWQLDQASFLPQLGKLLNDESAMCRAIVGARLSMANEIVFRVANYTTNQDPVGGNLLHGISELGRIVKRRDNTIRRGNLQDVNNAMQKKSMLTTLAEKSLRTQADQVVWSEALFGWLQWTDRETAGIWLAQLADNYLANNDLPSAFLTLDYLTTNYPDHPLTPVSLSIMTNYMSSEEVHVINEFRARLEKQAQSKPLPLADKAREDWMPLGAIQQHDNDNAGGVALLPGEVIRDDRLQLVGAIEDVEEESAGMDEATSDTPSELTANESFWPVAFAQIKRLRERDPELAAHPYIRAIEANVLRNATSWKEAANLYRQMAAPTNLNLATRHWATNENVRNSVSQKTNPNSIFAIRTNSKPFLDGVLDDDLWQAQLEQGHANMVMMTPLQTSQTAKTDFVMFAFDDEYLYLACRCTKLDNTNYPKSDAARTRDPEMKFTDRIVISFDIDRDCGWPLRFSIDSGGNAGESCGQSCEFDPQWFVATSQTERHWMVEAAVPLSELGQSEILNDECWQVGMARCASRSTNNLWDFPSPKVLERGEQGLWAFPEVCDDGYRDLVFRDLSSVSASPADQTQPSTNTIENRPQN